MPRFSLDQLSPRLKGDGEKDDTLSFMDAVRKLPPRARIVWPDDFRIRITDTLALERIPFLSFECEQRPHDAFVQDACAGFVWDGKAGHPMMALNRMLRPHFRGLAFFSTTKYDATGGADTCVDMDQLGPAGDIMSRASFEACAFVSGFRNRNWRGLRNANSSADNCEYATFRRCVWFGGAKPGGSLTRVYGLARDKDGASADGFTIDAGDNVVRAKRRGTFSKNDEKWQERIRIGGAGIGVNALPVLDANIVRVIDEHRAIISARATRSVSDAYALVGESYGVAFENGPHQNAKRILLEDCEMYGCAEGVRLLGGSAHMRDLNFSDNEVDIHIDCSQSEPSSEIGSNSEGSRSHLWHFGLEPYTMAAASRLAMNKIAAGGPYLALGIDPAHGWGGGPIELAGNHVEGDVPPASTVFDLRGGSRFIESRLNQYGWSWTREQMGWSAKLMAHGAKIHTLGDNMNGGAAQTADDEWILGGEGQTALTRRSGGGQHIRGLSHSDPLTAKMLQPGELAESGYVKRPDGSRVLRIIGRDWDGTPLLSDLPAKGAPHPKAQD